MSYFSLLNNLLIYRNILDDQLIASLTRNYSNDNQALVAKFLEKAEQLGLKGDLIDEYIFYLITYGENVFSRTAESQGKVGEGMLTAVAHDITVLREIFKADINFFGCVSKDSLQKGSVSFLSSIKGIISDDNSCEQKSQEICQLLMKNYCPSNEKNTVSLTAIKNIIQDDNITTLEAAQQLCEYYSLYGYGVLADFMAFKWNDNYNPHNNCSGADGAEPALLGINSCDDITFAEIIGYDRQKKDLMENTEAFLNGLPANNVLLYGERGTGKSSSVKALINKYFVDGLRLVEVSRSQFMAIPEILSYLKGIGKKFILYLDDLSFEEFEVEYKQLKSILDGGMETKPDNVLIYATSNRRNIIKEVWADNEGDELHRTDTINEKVSLADRFGLKIFFISPNQEAYLKIIKEKAVRAGLNLTDEELRKEAIKWEMSHSGRSGRIAEQLIVHLIGKKAGTKE